MGADNEEGLALIYMALALVVLLIFSAFAVDLGGLYNARRGDQSAADVAALGAAVELTGKTDAQTVATVEGLVHDNIDTVLTTWNTCGAVVDTDTVDIPMAGANCITRDASRGRIQVRVPVQQLSSVFGTVVGLDSYQHTAFAIAGTVGAGFGNVLPLGIAAGTGGGDGYVCAKTGPGGHAEAPCGGPESGNFGFLDFGYFGSDVHGTSIDCGNGGQRPRNSNNIAVGIDHQLSRYGAAPHGSAQVVDTASCGTVPEPNAAFTLTGNTPQEFGSGMFSGGGFSDGSPARLQRTDANLFAGAGQVADIGGHLLDDNALWEFITPGLDSSVADVPASCEPGQFTGSAGGLGTMLNLPKSVRTHLTSLPVAERMRRLLQRCFAHYLGGAWNDDGAFTTQGAAGEPSTGCEGPCDGVVFGRNSSTAEAPDLSDIQYTSRFGYIPELSGQFPDGTGTVTFDRFRAAFLQRLLGGNCSGGTCSHDFEPGVPYTGSSSSESKAEGMTAFVFPSGMLPNGLAHDDAPYAIGVNRFVRLLR